jgi:hypothetical protein|tara:strand:- start:1296 stop:1436 length:141 start_codon:yes stop_codon:yes gene_type:complete
MGNMKNVLKKIWKRLARKENWESRMGWEYFVMLFIGGMIAGAGALF